MHVFPEPTSLTVPMNMYNRVDVTCSPEDAAGARAHGAGGALGARVEHHAPHVRARAVGGAPRRAAGVAQQRGGGARRHAGRHAGAGRVRGRRLPGVRPRPAPERRPIALQCCSAIL